MLLSLPFCKWKENQKVVEAFLRKREKKIRTRFSAAGEEGKMD